MDSDNRNWRRVKEITAADIGRYVRLAGLSGFIYECYPTNGSYSVKLITTNGLESVTVQGEAMIGIYPETESV